MTSLKLPGLNYDIQNRSTYTKGKNGDFVETLDQKTVFTKLCRTIKGIDGGEQSNLNESSFSSYK